MSLDCTDQQNDIVTFNTINDTLTNVFIGVTPRLGVVQPIGGCFVFCVFDCLTKREFIDAFKDRGADLLLSMRFFLGVVV